MLYLCIRLPIQRAINLIVGVELLFSARSKKLFVNKF
jgi:hypothetical protein